MQLLARKFKDHWKRNPSFVHFNHLPPELRNKIWAFSLPDPRIVCLQRSRFSILQSIKYSGMSIQELYRTALSKKANDEESMFIYWSQTRVPTIYFVCREAQTVVERSYVNVFKTSFSPGVWIDFKQDVLYLAHEIYDPESGFYEAFPTDVRRINFLMLSGYWTRDSEEANDPYDHFDHVLDIGKALRHCGNVQWLCLVDAQHRLNHTEQLGMIPGHSKEHYEVLWRWLHPALWDQEPWMWSWPFIDFGVLVENTDDRRWWQNKRTWEKASTYTWKLLFENALRTLSRFR